MVRKIGLVVGCLVFLSTSAFAVPTKMNQQGRLVDEAGDGLDGIHALSFSLYDAATGGNQVWTESFQTEFDRGYYSVELGNLTPLDDVLFGNGALWLELTIDGEVLSPRQEVVSVPYALRATAAANVEGGSVDAEEIQVDGTVVIDSGGNWVGPPPAVDWNSLTGVPVDILDGDTDTLTALVCTQAQVAKWSGWQWACAADIDTDTDTLAAMPCALGEVAKWDGTTWACASDIDTDTDTDTLAGLVCAPGEVVKWDGTTWACASDIDTDTDTQLSEAQVEAFVSNAPISIDLAPGSTVGGDTLVSVPSGMIGFFAGPTCPPGWAEFTALRGRVAVGLPANGVAGASVGNALGDQALRSIGNVPAHLHSVDPPSVQASSSGASHSHSMSHNHSVNPPNTGTNNAGAHTHNLRDGVNVGDGLVGVNVGGGGHPGVPGSSGNGAPLNTTSNGSHSHTVDIASFSSGGSSTSQTGSGGSSHAHAMDITAFNSAASGVAAVDVTMPYLQLLACQAP